MNPVNISNNARNISNKYLLKHIHNISNNASAMLLMKLAMNLNQPDAYLELQQPSDNQPAERIAPLRNTRAQSRAPLKPPYGVQHDNIVPRHGKEAPS